MSSLDKYTFAESHPEAKQVRQNNNWYLQENGKNLTGFQKIADQNKICYYNPSNGAMVYGQQNINGHWQWFDLQTGRQAKSQFVNIKDQNKTVYYDGLGNMVYGQQKIDGHWYLFDKVTGTMQTGFQWLGNYG